MLDELGKEQFVRMMRKLAVFCGLEVVAYCVMSNHFHVLVRVPARTASGPTDAEILRRTEALYGRKGLLVEAVRESLKNRGKLDEHLRQRLLERMGDVSAYMKELKQRFSRWYNRRHDRYGTLWSERFKSVLVEDQPSAVGTLASYIDLNPVRAGLVEDPKDYRFCSYAAAMAGNTSARKGLMSFLDCDSWAAAEQAYRKQLFVRAGVSGRSDKAVMDRAQIKRVLAQGGKITPAQALRLRIRYLTDGVVLGSKEFVNEVFALHREKFGPKRRDGARPLRGLPLPGLAVLRNLQVRAVT